MPPFSPVQGDTSTLFHQCFENSGHGVVRIVQLPGDLEGEEGLGPLDPVEAHLDVLQAFFIADDDLFEVILELLDGLTAEGAGQIGQVWDPIFGVQLDTALAGVQEFVKMQLDVRNADIQLFIFKPLFGMSSQLSTVFMISSVVALGSPSRGSHSCVRKS